MDADRSAEANFFDAVSPTVTLTAPADSATLSGDVTLSATAHDDQSGIDVVQFRLVRANGDFVAIIGNDPTPPFEMDWHTREADNGVYAIQARARDNGGRESIDAVGVLIANPIGVRYAAPGANGADPCLASSPCSLKHAIEHAISGEEVVVPPGDYLVGN